MSSPGTDATWRLRVRRQRARVLCLVLALACLVVGSLPAAPGQGEEQADVQASFERVFEDFPRAFLRASNEWLRSMGMPPIHDQEEFILRHALVDRTFAPVEGQPGRWIARTRLADASLASEYWVFEFEYAEGRWQTRTGVRHIEDSQLDLYQADPFTTSMRPFVERELEALQIARSGAEAREEPPLAATDERLLGRWTPVVAVAPGAEDQDQPERLGLGVWEFEPGVMRVGNGLESVEFPYRVQPGAEPARLDHDARIGGAEFTMRSVYRLTEEGLLEIVQNLRPGLPYPPAVRPGTSDSFTFVRLRRLTSAEEEAFGAGPVSAKVRPYLDALLKKGVRFDTDPKGRIRTVMMSRADVTDAELRELPRLGAFTALSLLGTGVTDEGLRHVARLTSLERLQLGMTRIGDAGLRELRSLRNLRGLSLMGTSVTDASVPVLGAMKQLRELDVGGTRLSPAGVEELRRLLPDCEITR